MSANSSHSKLYNLNLAFHYLKYLWQGKKLHGTHSPFVYSFVENVLLDDRQYYAFREIEQFRQQLISSNESIEIEDFGAGSKVFNSSKRSISKLASAGSIKAKFGQLLFRMVNHFQPGNIVELGTQLGLGSIYMAKAKPSSRIISHEASGELAAVAERNFEIQKVTNVEINIGQFKDTLPQTCKEIGTIDLAFIDGDHRYESTLRYYEQCMEFASEEAILIFDDIRWSVEMEKAWKKICLDEKATLTIDLFFMGIVFLGLKTAKQHHVLKY